MRMLPALFTLASTLVPLMATPNVSKTTPANPFLGSWKTPFGAPPFDLIKDEHYLPAFKAGITQQKGEIQAIVRNPAAPTFQNTLEALEESGLLLERVSSVFNHITAAETTDRLQAVAMEVAPLLAAHQDDINLDAALFNRVKAVYGQRGSLGLDPEQKRLLERTYDGFVRSGALLDEARKQRLRAINGELSTLTVKYNDNLLKETNAFRLVLDKREDLAGLPESQVAAAAEAARKAGQEGKWVFTLHAPSLRPFLQYANNRELRRQLWTANMSRCDRGNGEDNKAIVVKMALLRLERAKLLGFPTHADYVLDDRMAKNPGRALELLNRIWKPALETARRDAKVLQGMIDAEKGGFTLAAWDWPYYAEKLKKARLDLNEEEFRPYLPLDRVRQGAFEVARKLYGLTFRERKDLPLWHPDVQVYEVLDHGKFLGLFYTDYFPRPGKQGGAWNDALRRRCVRQGETVTPIYFSVANFARPTAGKPALLSRREAETLFHEFGHALHGLLYQGRYASLNSVYWDFVELPSQIMENWFNEPAVLKGFARHYATGEVIPDSLLQKMAKVQVFNQGYSTASQLGLAYVDLAWYTLKEPKALDVATVERETFERLGKPEAIPVVRSVNSDHIFAGGYDAGYYAYTWAEVLDADAFERFKEKGLFDPSTAAAFRELLSKGGTVEPAELYRRFRGAEPSVDPLLKRRGLK